MERRELLAGALVLAFTVSFALTNTTASLAFIGGSDPLTVANARFTFAAVALAVILRATGTRFSLPRRDAYVAIALGLITAVYSFAVLKAIEILPVSLAVLIFFMFPLFTSLIVAVMGWEKLTGTTVAAALIAFAGLALALGVDSAGLAISGVIYGLIGGFGLAIVSAVSSRVIRSGDSRPVTLYIVTTAAAVFIVVTLVRGDLQLPQSSSGWVGFAGTSVFYTSGIILYFATIALIGPAKATLYSYVEPLFTMAVAFLVLGELLMPLQIVGALIVVGALAASSFVGSRKR
jgi:DME family drug/metabolite transporter